MSEQDVRAQAELDRRIAILTKFFHPVHLTVLESPSGKSPKIWVGPTQTKFGKDVTWDL